MTDSLQLFDPSVYGPGSKRRSQKRADSREAISSRVETHQDPWTCIRLRDGVAPFFHLINVRVATGAVVTVCGIMGNNIPNVGVTQMIRCPTCDVGAQVEQLAML